MADLMSRLVGIMMTFSKFSSSPDTAWKSWKNDFEEREDEVDVVSGSGRVVGEGPYHVIVALRGAEEYSLEFFEKDVGAYGKQEGRKRAALPDASFQGENVPFNARRSYSAVIVVVESIYSIHDIGRDATF